MTYTHLIPQPQKLIEIIELNNFDLLLDEKLVVKKDRANFTFEFLKVTPLENIEVINSICKASRCNQIELCFVYQESADVLAKELPIYEKFDSYENCRTEISKTVTTPADGIPYLTIRFLGF